MRKKNYKNSNVFEETLDRLRYIYDSFDKVVIAFSGGKDSTALLNCALIVAEEKNKLPLEAVFMDEEAIHPTTIEYVDRVRKDPRIKLDWYCLEFKHRNACSNEEPYWYCWEKEKQDIWVRDMPEFAIKEHKNFYKGLSFQSFTSKIYEKKDGKVIILNGIRTEESLRRYRVIASKKNDAFILSKAEPGTNCYRGYPIYDWSSEDVWLAVTKFNWDYNRTYDIFNKTKLHNKFLAQRVCPPFGEEPLRGLWIYAECFPEMWHKMLNRVEGVSTAWRYSNTELYSNANKKPEHLSYREYLDVLLDSYDNEARNVLKKNINTYITYHKNKSKKPIPDSEANPISGLSWKYLCRVALRGDMKGRQKSGLIEEARKQLKKLGITLEEAKRIYT